MVSTNCYPSENSSGELEMNKGDIIVREAMKMNPVTVSPDTTVQEAAELMRKHRVGSCIVIVEKPIGIITERDIVHKVVSQDLKASDVKVKDIMSSPIIVIDPYKSIEEAMRIMANGNIRRLPVIENGELVGIITQRDIARISPVLLEILRDMSGVSRENYLKERIYSGKCEDCGTLSTRLRLVDGRLLCEDCIDALRYE